MQIITLNLLKLSNLIINNKYLVNYKQQQKTKQIIEMKELQDKVEVLSFNEENLR